MTKSVSVLLSCVFFQNNFFTLFETGLGVVSLHVMIADSPVHPVEPGGKDVKPSPVKTSGF